MATYNWVEQTVIASPMTATLYEMVYNSQGWYAGGYDPEQVDGAVLVSADWLNHWSSVGDFSNEEVYCCVDGIDENGNDIWTMWYRNSFNPESIGRTTLYYDIEAESWYIGGMLPAEIEPTGNAMCAISMVPPEHFISVGDSGTILESTDGGENWSAMTSGTTENLYGVCCLTVEELWMALAVGDNGTLIMTTSDMGGTWIDTELGLSGSLRGVATGIHEETSAWYIFVVGLNGVVYQFETTETEAVLTSETLGSEDYYSVAFKESDGDVAIGGENTSIWYGKQTYIPPVVTHTITATAYTGGTITPSGAVEVIRGEQEEFTIAASTGYVILDVEVDDVSQGAIASYEFDPVYADHTIEATFFEFSPLDWNRITVGEL